MRTKQKQHQQKALGSQHVGTINKSPARTKSGAARASRRATQSSALHLWLRYKADAKHGLGFSALRRKAGSAPYNFMAHNETNGANH